jgi:hypothetical protein
VPKKQPRIKLQTLPNASSVSSESEPGKGASLRLNSALIKTAVLGHFRFNERYIYICTEASPWNADILMIDPKDYLVEIEVKVSIADLKADLKKPKHRAYQFCREKRGIVPNRMYFAVSEAMGTRAKEILAAYPAYGILTVNESDRTVKLFKKAGWIHKKHKATEKDKRMIILRMGSELIGLRRRKDKENPEELLVPLEDDILDLSPFVLHG